jgi:sulfide:quinone oxidoreductase
VTKITLPGRYNPETTLVLPKAGVMAEAQGIVVADQIAAKINKTTPASSFDGAGVCYLETGGGEAITAKGQFFREPHPVMASDPPSSSGFEEKLLWIKTWLEVNLGG